MLPRLATLVRRITSISVLPDSVLVGIRQQRQEARALHGDSELPLVEGLRAGDAARHDLARLGDIALERGEVLVVDVLHAFGGEAAELLPAGEAAVRALSVHGHDQPSPAGALSSSEALSSRGGRSRRRSPPPPSSS